MEKILEGNLSRFGVPDVLTFLNMGRRAGLLALERNDQETKLFLRDGNIVFATTTREELRLGTLLVRMGKLAPEALTQVLSEQRGTRARLGHSLINRKIVTVAELGSYLKVQVSEIIFETFTWTEGVFTMWAAVTPPATAVTLEMSLQNLLMEGSRRIDERGRLKEFFPDLNMAVEVVSNPERVKQSVTMTPEEWQVFFLADGRRSLSEICRLAGNPDELATLQIIHHFVVSKMLMVVPPAPAAPLSDAAAGVVDGEGTSLHLGAQAPLPAAVSVEFASAIRPAVSRDDTKKIVTAKAVQYLKDARSVTVSRLILLKQGSEASFPLTGDTYAIGRHRNNDIVISDPKVSSFHARVDRGPEGFVLVDLKSRNGCYVNNKRVEHAVLKTGDEIRLGTARLAYKVDYTSTLSN
jgi:hypothetical protein